MVVATVVVAAVAMAVAVKVAVKVDCDEAQNAHEIVRCNALCGERAKEGAWCVGERAHWTPKYA